MPPARRAGLPDPGAARELISETVPELGPGIARQARDYADAVRPFLDRLGLRPADKRREAAALFAEIVSPDYRNPSDVLSWVTGAWSDRIPELLQSLGIGSYPGDVGHALARVKYARRVLRDHHTRLHSVPHDEMKSLLIDLHGGLVALADNAGGTVPRAPLLPERHPPLSARLGKGIVAERAAETLAALIDAGLDEHRAALEGAWPGLPRHSVLCDHYGKQMTLSNAFAPVLRRDFAELDNAGLARMPRIYIEFKEATQGFETMERLADPSGLGPRSRVWVEALTDGIRLRIVAAYAAYAAIGVNYLAEVLDLMPHYARMAGQDLGSFPSCP
ncbi:MAG: hypothetical protein J2P25_10080 [Nocardiopsaceae bacterium]|nr:hypothetical protein [Nocardiopsaceae bacterium]